MKQLDELCKSACAFHYDKNYRLFVTVVQSEGIYIRFPGPPSRFSFRYCHSGTAIQTRGTVAGIYGIRRLQVKRSGRLGARAVLALDCCRPQGTWSGFALTMRAVTSKNGDLMRFHGKSARGPFEKPGTWSGFVAKVHAVPSKSQGPGAVSGQKCARSHRCAVSTS